MPQSAVNFTMPHLMPERLLVRKFPQPYNEEISPYSTVKDFSNVVLSASASCGPAVAMPHQPSTAFKMRPCKVIFVGDVSVGKTTIVNRFCYDKFQGNYKATIGVDFEVENFNILGQNYSLEMWDTAGQERFKCIAQAYYRNANVIVVVFDMSKVHTLYSTATWLKSALAVNSIQKPLIFLVGTKSDLLPREDFVRVEKLAGEVARGIKAEYWSVSARTGFKIVDLFHRIAALSFETTFKETILERKYMEKSIAAEMQKKSPNFDFRRHLACNEKSCANERGACLC